MLLGKAEKGTLLLAFPWVRDGKALADIWEELQTWPDDAEMSADIMLTMKKLHNFSSFLFSHNFLLYTYSRMWIFRHSLTLQNGEKIKALNIRKYIKLQSGVHQSGRVLLNSKVNLCLLEVSKLLGEYLPLGKKMGFENKTERKIEKILKPWGDFSISMVLKSSRYFPLGFQFVPRMSWHKSPIQGLAHVFPPPGVGAICTAAALGNFQ